MEQNDSLVKLIPGDEYKNRIGTEARLDLLLEINNEISREVRTPQLMKYQNDIIIPRIEKYKKLLD